MTFETSTGFNYSSPCPEPCYVTAAWGSLQHLLISTKKCVYLIRLVPFYSASVILKPCNSSRFLSHIPLLLQKLQYLN